MYNNICQIHVTVAVDVLKALQDGSLPGNVFLMDDSPWESGEQGTHALATACKPGCRVLWTVIPVDLQTDVAIREISFHDAERTEPGVESSLRTKTWEGVVPSLPPGQHYRYRLSLQMGHGKRSVMSIDTPSLFIVQPENDVEPLNVSDNNGQAYNDSGNY